MYNNDYRPYGGNYPDAAALASTVSSSEYTSKCSSPCS